MNGRVPKRILVVANETVGSPVLHEAVAARAGGLATEVLVVAPALNGRLRHWASDDHDARTAAAIRLERCLARLAEAGIPAVGLVGDADPLLAIADALRAFPAHELVLATHPEGRSNWLARNLVANARARFGLPTIHIVVDAAAKAEYVASVAA
jgi:hypothetical protein